MSTLKSVLITGAGSGIGAATAKVFSEHGYHVYLLGRDQKKLDQVQTKLKSSEILVCDLSSAEQIEKTVSKLLAVSPSLEILVNNAGVFSAQSFLETSDVEWSRQWEVNMMGPVRLTRALLPYFQKRKKGSLVHVSSTLGLSPTLGTVAYSAIKAAMINWSAGLALEGGEYNIRSNVVCPGLVDTPIHAFNQFAQNEKEAHMKKLGPLQPLGRIGTPEEIANSIYFLGSDLSSWTTGAVLSVDGGINLK